MKLKNLSTYIGIDFGSDTAKAVALVKDKDSFALHSYALESTAGVDLTDPAQIVPVAKRLMSKLGKSNKHVFISISSKAPVIRYQNINKIPLQNLRAMLKSNSSQFLSQDYSDYNLDCYEFPDRDEKQPAEGDKPASAPTEQKKQGKYLIAGAPKNEVSAIFEAFKALKYAPVIVQVSGVSLMNSYEFAKIQDFQGSSCLLVDVGNSFSTISLINKGSYEFVRILDFGGNTIAEAIAKEKGCELITAHQLKLNPDEETKTIIDGAVAELIRAIQGSITFFEGQTGGTIKKIDLSGGVARSLYIRETLANTLELPVELWNPFQGISLKKLKSSMQGTIQTEFCLLGSAVGAASEGLFMS